MSPSIGNDVHLAGELQGTQSNKSTQQESTQIRAEQNTSTDHTVALGPETDSVYLSCEAFTVTLSFNYLQ